MIEFPTDRHFKEWDTYRLWLVNKLENETNKVQRTFFEYRIKILDTLLRLKK